MITTAMLQKIKDFAYSQSEKYLAPSVIHLDYANKKGQWLAAELSANKEIVLMGTMLMDCMLGEAMSEGRTSEHIQMSAEKTKELLAEFKDLTDSEKETIISCVREHHGAEKFQCLESEICCNADCYRFASVKGALGGMVLGRSMPLADLVKLYSQKADEKWKLVSFDICKQELESQYTTIKQLFARYEN